ncbi:MAG: triphosphoribosyl-dephospho-CoA synthase [Planctomycetes bacterium]|nr:triphosphoribosyl-dephospho-CoA synthase [Planctomycetota bacterium]
MNQSLSIGQCATLACLLEVTAPKPGNVHRGADFDDVSFDDFVASAVAIGPVMERATSQNVGQTVLLAVTATRSFVATNTNLGTVLLIAPLATVPGSQDFSEGIANVLSGLTVQDTAAVYEAIRQAKPGGLGEVDSMDVADAAPTNLLAAMRAASNRDLVARQYTNNFEQVLDFVLPSISKGRDSGLLLRDAIVHAHVALMSDFPDSLIARKCGQDIAQQAANRAGAVLAAGAPGGENYLLALADLDFWLRSDGHRRNPGTTADLIAAGLFVDLRLGEITPPFR